MVGRYVSSPIDIERVMPSMKHGDWNHGEMTQDQLGIYRPWHEYGPYRTAFENVYLCGCVDTSRRVDRRRLRLQRRRRDRVRTRESTRGGGQPPRPSDMPRGARPADRADDEAGLDERRRRFPAGAAIEFADLEEHGRASTLDRLREAEPVSWVPVLGGWLVTDYALARELLGPRDDTTVWAEPNLVRASLGVMMLTSDPPDHDRQRSPFDEPFRWRPVRERFEAVIADRIDRLLDGLAPAGACELASEFAEPFAIGVAGDILGLSLDDVARIQGFYEAFAGAMTYDGDPEPQRRADAARDAFNAILIDELARVRREPDGSITSAVANDAGRGAGRRRDRRAAPGDPVRRHRDRRVDDREHDPAPPREPGPSSTVLAEPELVGNAVEESMRLIPPVAFIERWTTRPTTLGDVALERGEFVGVSTLAAGRDPCRLPRPAPLRRPALERPPPSRVQLRRPPLPRLQPGAAPGNARDRGDPRAPPGTSSSSRLPSRTASRSGALRAFGCAGSRRAARAAPYASTCESQLAGGMTWFERNSSSGSTAALIWRSRV